MLIIEVSKINIYDKRRKCIDIMKRFHWYNYEVYYIDMKSIKTITNNIDIILNTNKVNLFCMSAVSAVL